MNKKELIHFKIAMLTQEKILAKVNENSNKIKDSFDDNNEVKGKISSLNSELDELTRVAMNRSHDISFLEDIDEEQLEEIYQKKYVEFNRIEKIDANSWEELIVKYTSIGSHYEIDYKVPYDLFLSEEDIQKIKSEDYQSQFKWDKWDYSFVGLAGVVAGLIDFLAVKIPKDMTSGLYAGQEGSGITKWLQEQRFPPKIQDTLEAFAKASYDRTGGSEHRLDTFGHGPILGIIFGTIDIMRGGALHVKGGELGNLSSITEGLNNPILAILKQIAHLLSDVATTRGLPVPFAHLIRLMKFGSFERANGKTATISDLMQFMYYHGYDLRHFVTMGLAPGSIELIIRSYILIKRFCNDEEFELKLASNPKYRSMLLSAHSIACATNVGKVAVYQGNPLAVNYAQWIAMLRYLAPSIKYWVFDKKKIELQHLKDINSAGWEELTLRSDDLLKDVIKKSEMSFKI